jgi:hypothetical protein
MSTKDDVKTKLFRDHAQDTPFGDSNATALKLSEVLGMGETQVIRFATRQLRNRPLLHYPADVSHCLR